MEFDIWNQTSSLEFCSEPNAQDIEFACFCGIWCSPMHWITTSEFVFFTGLMSGKKQWTWLEVFEKPRLKSLG